jgi:CBS domain containing-hemolysin-like protein
MPNLPVSFKEFMKDPVKALLYLALIAIVGLFSYLQMASASEKKLLREQLLKCDTANYVQDVEMKQLRNQFIETASVLKKLEGRIETLKELGRIQ